jgi:cardiolipin synthase
LEDILNHLPTITTLLFVVELIIIFGSIPWILIIKRDSTSAIAWSLIVILLPIIGFILFIVFGYTHVYRPLKKKRRHRARVRAERSAGAAAASRAGQEGETWQEMGRLALRLGGFPVSDGNAVTLYHEGEAKFAALYDAIRRAQHHIHLEYFIVRPDTTGQEVFDLLIEKARHGVQVRVLYDAIGSRGLPRRMLRALREAGGKVHAFLPINIWRRRIQVNLRNHRKIAVMDGNVAFIGGVNIGREYRSQDPSYPYWRDTHLRLEGPAAGDMQRVFAEDWDFATGEKLLHDAYYPDTGQVGDARVQIIESGPDQEFNTFRDLLFAAFTMAREKIWIQTPYFVPDQGILDALRLASRRGVDVRILSPARPDHWLTHFASGYYFAELIPEGVRVYLYKKGMMHAKVLTIDGEWGYVGTANLDNRSLHLNFEVNCVIHSRRVIAELEQAYLRDQEQSDRLERRQYGARGFLRRLAENACRLLSPVL